MHSDHNILLQRNRTIGELFFTFSFDARKLSHSAREASLTGIVPLVLRGYAWRGKIGADALATGSFRSFSTSPTTCLAPVPSAGPTLGVRRRGVLPGYGCRQAESALRWARASLDPGERGWRAHGVLCRLSASGSQEGAWRAILRVLRSDPATRCSPRPNLRHAASLRPAPQE